MALKRKLSQEFDDAAYTVSPFPSSHCYVNFEFPYLALTLLDRRVRLSDHPRRKSKSTTTRNTSPPRTRQTWTSTCRMPRRARSFLRSISPTILSTPAYPPPPARQARMARPPAPPVSLSSSVHMRCSERYVVASYPAFDLYPHDPNSMTIDTADYFNLAAESSPRMSGLLQPKGFSHHG